MELLNKDYWENRYQDQQTGWDIGYPSPAICAYFDQINNKEVGILIPGCGNAYEGEYLHNAGFDKLHLLDYSELTKEHFLKRVPSFNGDHFFAGDFFEHRGNYDYIVEQTFFCALEPKLRAAYVDKMHQLLKPGGKLIGLMFSIPLFEDHPPFGGNAKEYKALFESQFEILHMETAENSIPQRMGNELFIELRRK